MPHPSAESFKPCMEQHSERDIREAASRAEPGSVQALLRTGPWKCADDVEANFSRSSGAGGQNVNKVSTKADIRFDVVNCRWMSRALKQAVMQREANRMNKNGELLISSQVTRSQADNLEDAVARLQGLLDDAAESIKPIESDPAKVKTLEKRKKKARYLHDGALCHPCCGVT